MAILLLVSATGRAEKSTTDADIDFLLDNVVSSDCVFTRNGSEYAALAARDHLQMKRKRGKRQYHNAEEFIEKIASRSSWTGTDYLIRCGGAPQQTAREWFSALLQEYRKTTQIKQQ